MDKPPSNPNSLNTPPQDQHGRRFSERSATEINSSDQMQKFIIAGIPVELSSQVTPVPEEETMNPVPSSAKATALTKYPFLSPPEAPDELGRFDGYRILGLLGEGGMGYVFRGEEVALHLEVALKVMRPEIAAKPLAVERFIREGRAAASLKSDHVITIYQVGEANGVPFLAMEFLDGLSVDAWLKLQKKPIPLSRVLRITRDTLRGLAVAHEKGLVHRDIKPANLWIEKATSRVKVLDFGLTRSEDKSDQVTAEGLIMGTPAYMAPEQASA
jgi:tRNA A-37 threonylcarbamoyl transferase component Bud32